MAGLHSIGMSPKIQGFSVSVYPADANELEPLNTPTPLSAWPGAAETEAVAHLFEHFTERA